MPIGIIPAGTAFLPSGDVEMLAANPRPKQGCQTFEPVTLRVREAPRLNSNGDGKNMVQQVAVSQAGEQGG